MTSEKEIKIINTDIHNENVYVLFQLEKLNINFNKVIHLYTISNEQNNNINQIIEKLLLTYKTLVDQNKRKDLLFCLDSFFFQCKIFKQEFDNLNNFRLLFYNRLYCDYYKLYSLMIDDLNDLKLLPNHNYNLNKYENYKDLEPTKEYKLKDIEDLNKDIIDILSKLCFKYTKMAKYINDYNKNNQVGYTISNFLNTLTYENNNLLEKITLYKNFIAFFDQSHINHFQKLIDDYDIFKKNLQENITSSNYLTINDLDEEVLLLDQIDSDDNSDNSSPRSKDISFNDIVHQDEPNVLQVIERVDNDKDNHNDNDKSKDENITIVS